MPTRRATRATRKIKQTLRSVPASEVEGVIEEAKVVAEARAKQTGAPEPGMTLNGEKVPLTYGYMLEHPEKFGPVVTWVPERTVPLFINGVRLQLLAGLETHAPKAFKDIYDRAGKANRESSGKHLGETGYEAIVALGAGSLET